MVNFESDIWIRIFNPEPFSVPDFWHVYDQTTIFIRESIKV